ncbi:MAG: ferritin family protein [Candidatus Anammoxibacter sp.]
MGISGKMKEIVESAIKLEKDGVKFYTDASNKNIHPLGKAMFKSFIEEEKKHLEKLEELFSKDMKAGEGKPYAGKAEDAFDKLKNLFRQMYKEGDVDVEPSADDLQAVRAAIDFEKAGNKIYVDAVEAAENQVEKELFTFLANEEEAHLGILENMHKEMGRVYKQEAKDEQRSQIEWERKLFRRPDAHERQIG